MFLLILKNELIIKFIYFRKFVDQKLSLFMLWEDKNAYLFLNFAWHLDKVTKILKIIILIESAIKLNKFLKTFFFISKSI